MPCLTKQKDVHHVIITPDRCVLYKCTNEMGKACFEVLPVKFYFKVVLFLTETLKKNKIWCRLFNIGSSFECKR